MPQTVVIIGAGGKMGMRAAEKIGGHSHYRVLMCENNPERAQSLGEKGFQVIPVRSALAEGDVIVMAVPDALIGRIAHELAPSMKKGSTLIMLDAAAAYIGELPSRDDITMMIAHPCHPPFFTEQATTEARRDYFGGIAVQDILVSLISGSEEQFQEGVGLCKVIFAPVRGAHRVTPEQWRGRIATSPPALPGPVLGLRNPTAAALMKASLDEAVKRGVPRKAAEAFMAGHAQIAMAIVFGAEKSPFSDAAQLAIKWGMGKIISPDWQKVFEPGPLREAIRFMLHSEEAHAS